SRMGELLLSRDRHSGVSGARQLCGCAVASVVALQAQDQTKQGRQLSTLAPLRDLRARASDPAWTRRAVDEGVKSCPRGQCGKSARCVRGEGCGKGARVEPLRHRQTKGAETDMPSLPPPRHIPTLPVDAPFQARENVGIVAARGRMLDPETGRLWLQPTVRSPPSR